MSPTHLVDKRVVAFEVAKETLVVHTLPDDRQSTIANTAKAIRKLLMGEIRCNGASRPGSLLVVCEATGGYERLVLEICVELGLAVHKAHGARVRHFAKYLGLLAKTDQMDARVLALYGAQTEGLRLYVPPTVEQVALRHLKTRRDQVQQMLAAETNRLEHVQHASVRKSLVSHIALLREALMTLEAEIAAHLKASERLARKACLMRSFKGVGPATTVTLLAYMPELGTFRKGEVARLAGLAPINNDSGKSQAPRHIVHGRSSIRSTLYMAALVAIRHNPVMRRFAAKLRQSGKPFKVTITAVMRKLIVTLNAILRSGQPWVHANSA